MKRFKAPGRFFRDLDAGTSAKLIGAATEISVVIDRRGIVRDVSFGSAELAAEVGGAWESRPWVDTVAPSSRSEASAMLDSSSRKAAPRRSYLIHHVLDDERPTLPVIYQAVRLGTAGRILAVGRDPRRLAVLQQRLLDAEHSMRGEQQALRATGAGYRELFELTAEAVLVVDGATRKIVEANRAAVRLLGMDPARLIGSVFPQGFDVRSEQAIIRQLAAASSKGQARARRVQWLAHGRELWIAATAFRQEGDVKLLVQMAPIGGSQPPSLENRADSRVAAAIETLPDGVVLTDEAGRILEANRTFLDLAELVREDQARGQPLERWFGGTDSELAALMAQLRVKHETSGHAATVRGEHGATSRVDISATTLLNGDDRWFGFSIRSIAQPDTSTAVVEKLTERVGRLAMKEMVREVTDAIERLCIETALKLADDNRASTAAMLGLSRQSLYVKLRRHGLGDLSGSEGEREP